MLQWRRAKGEPHPIEMRQPVRPQHHAYLLNWFFLLSRARGMSDLGFQPIPWSEIDAWCRLMQIKPRPWELDAILRLDRVWMSVMGEKGHPFESIEEEQKARTLALPAPGVMR